MGPTNVLPLHHPSPQLSHNPTEVKPYTGQRMADLLSLFIFHRLSNAPRRRMRAMLILRIKDCRMYWGFYNRVSFSGFFGGSQPQQVTTSTALLNSLRISKAEVTDCQVRGSCIGLSSFAGIDFSNSLCAEMKLYC